MITAFPAWWLLVPVALLVLLALAVWRKAHH